MLNDSAEDTTTLFWSCVNQFDQALKIRRNPSMWYVIVKKKKIYIYISSSYREELSKLPEFWITGSENRNVRVLEILAGATRGSPINANRWAE